MKTTTIYGTSAFVGPLRATTLVTSGVGISARFALETGISTQFKDLLSISATSESGRANCERFLRQTSQAVAIPSSSKPKGTPTPIAALSPVESPCFLLLSRDAVLRGPPVVVEDSNVLTLLVELTLVVVVLGPTVGVAVGAVVVALELELVTAVMDELDEPPVRLTDVEYWCTSP
jgi:hypothetical protein